MNLVDMAKDEKNKNVQVVGGEIIENRKDDGIDSFNKDKKPSRDTVLERITQDKINQLIHSSIDLRTINFDEFKIRGSDFDMSLLPGNGAEGEEFQKAIEQANRALFKCYKVELEKLESTGKETNKENDSREMLMRDYRKKIFNLYKEKVIVLEKSKKVTRVAWKYQIKPEEIDIENLSKEDMDDLSDLCRRLNRRIQEVWEKKINQQLEDNTTNNNKVIKSDSKEEDNLSQSKDEEKTKERDLAEIPEDKQEKSSNVDNGKKENLMADATKAKKIVDSIERNKKIIELKAEVEKSRKEYLEADYEKKRAFKRIYSFLGSSFKDKKESNLKEDMDLAHYRAYYDNKLFDLQKIMVEDAKEKGASDNELVDLATYFDTEQKITMAESYDQVKAEKQDNRFLGVFGKKLVDYSKAYREMPLRGKLMVAGVFFGASALALSSGGAVLGVASATIVTARKIIMGMFSGVGTTLWLEKRGKTQAQEKIEEKKRNLLDEIAGKSAEDKIKFISDNIKNIAIRDEKNFLQKIKNQDLRQKFAGVSVGFASVMIPLLFKEYAGDLLDCFADTKSPIETIPVGLSESSNVVENILTVEKGSSFEGTLIKHLSDPNAQIYKYYPDLKGVDPGKIAQRLALDFSEDHKVGLPSLIHPDAKIKINFDPAALKLGKSFEEAINIDIDDKLGYGELPVTSHPSPVSVKDSVSLPEIKSAPSVVVDVPVEPEIDSSLNSLGKNNFIKWSDTESPEDIERKLTRLSSNRWRLADEIVAREGASVDVQTEEIAKLDLLSGYLSQEKSHYQKIMQSGKWGEFKNLVRSFKINVTGANEQVFDKVQNMKMLNQGEIIRNLPPKGRILFDKAVVVAEPLRFETFSQWTRRVCRIIVEKK